MSYLVDTRVWSLALRRDLQQALFTTGIILQKLLQGFSGQRAQGLSARVKPLFDQNLSPRLVTLLEELFPESAHVSRQLLETDYRGSMKWIDPISTTPTRKS